MKTGNNFCSNANLLKLSSSILLACTLAACSEESPMIDAEPEQETAQPGNLPGPMPAATGARLVNCSNLNELFSFGNTELTINTLIAAGEISSFGGGLTVGEHCQVRGHMNQRISPIDGNSYEIGFEMRLPTDWNGRFYYQANGGTDGAIGTALGRGTGGGALSSALGRGFAVISSDAGHQSRTPFFGVDPQARLDYGYNAVAVLTPMAKAMIAAAYGRTPDRSYFGGCSNGGRHAMVAAARYADLYDGIIAGNPGTNLPQAAVAQLYGVQQFSLVATATNANGEPDISTAFTQEERNMIAANILARCDSLDGLADGIVADSNACQAVFDLQTDVPTCETSRDGTCLSTEQKTVLDNIMSGARNSAGDWLYVSWPYDPGIAGSNWASWKYGNSTSQNRDPGASAFIFTTPPAALDLFDNMSPYEFAINFSMDTDAPRIFATDEIYTESPMSFMTPPNPNDLSTLRDRGAKLMVYHGVSDPVFSVHDSTRWYEELDAENNGAADDFARLYLVPGMNHCSGGPSTDQFDMLSAMVAWVEEGEEPDRILATARGEGNPGGVNDELPADWAADRSRPLCPYPQVARYDGSGDIELASSFSCEAP